MPETTTVATTWATIDGSEACARIAHAASELIAIYPITPSSVMAELADDWSAGGRPNLWGQVPKVVEMQSEAGAAGTLHGAVTKGVLGTTFTASQGLLLMIPNMYKIAGELTPAVIHVAARTVATHALSIFGDHSDVMAVRGTGWAMLSATNVQEAQDFAAVAHAATVRTRVPFVHFMDGFRTSHELNRIELLGLDDLQALIHEEDVIAHRSRGLTPDKPVLRGSSQNPDVFFQAREAANPFYLAVPEVVEGVFEEFEALTGRAYNLVEYHGAPDADRVVIALGSAWHTLCEVADQLNAAGEKVGVATIRLYRPFPVEQLIAALPTSVKRIAVLDRTKEPGAPAEPLFEDVAMALLRDRTHFAAGIPELIGGRYGLSSKEFDPPMAAAVFAELAAEHPKREFTVGINDDVTKLSLKPVPIALPGGALTTAFFGLGSDGTVGAAKNTVKIIGADRPAQGYFVYDSRKAGATTVSHLRFGQDPIDKPYLITDAGFVAVHNFQLLTMMPTLDIAAEGATVLLNSPYPADATWQHLPLEIQQLITEKHLDVWVINANRIAHQAGLGSRINTVMQPCFFQLSGVLPQEEAIARIKESIAKTYGKRGPQVVEQNYAAVDAALAGLERLVIPVPESAEVQAMHRFPDLPLSAPDFVQRVTAMMLHGEGELLPVSALPPDGVWPTATSKWEKRAINTELPLWDASLCIDCGKCAIACPHAAIRLKVAPASEFENAPDIVDFKNYRDRELKDYKLMVQVSPDDCTGCAICVDVCPAVSRTDPNHKSLDMVSALEHRETENAKYDFFESLPQVERDKVRHDQVKGVSLLEPLFEFSLACSGCGETPYLKTLTQLFGDRMVVANATGCSSIFGGNLPTTPWAQNAAGRGPAWSNSLFEDNAEFGLGMRLAWEQQNAEARRLLSQIDGLDPELVAAILEADQSDEPGIEAQRARVETLKKTLVEESLSGSPLGDVSKPTDDGFETLRSAEADRSSSTSVQRLLTLADELVKKSVWIVGGDGWAYDIGFGGLDHVLASGANVNILVLDTQVYSNTGGQASKATPRGAAAKFAADGKPTEAKDLGRLAQHYPGVYVAQVAIGANQQQTVRALVEAEAWDGPSIVIAYSTCIAHGIDMATSKTHQSGMVASGYWPLYRFRPNAEPSLKLDSKAPSTPIEGFMASEGRFAMLERSDPARADALATEAQSDADGRWAFYSQLATPQAASPSDAPKPADPVALAAQKAGLPLPPSQ
jgi:pyruvate-ferredoxin/flavodoxin oxidoreductase